MYIIQAVAVYKKTPNSDTVEKKPAQPVAPKVYVCNSRDATFIINIAIQHAPVLTIHATGKFREPQIYPKTSTHSRK